MFIFTILNMCFKSKILQVEGHSQKELEFHGYVANSGVPNRPQSPYVLLCGNPPLGGHCLLQRKERNDRGEEEEPKESAVVVALDTFCTDPFFLPGSFPLPPHSHPRSPLSREKSFAQFHSPWGDTFFAWDHRNKEL